MFIALFFQLFSVLEIILNRNLGGDWERKILEAEFLDLCFMGSGGRGR